MERVHSANRSQAPFDMDVRMLARDGHVVWFRDQAAPVADATGQTLHWQGLMIDITEIRQREREWEAIARLSNALRQTQTVKEILPRLLDETLSVMNTDQGSVWLHDPLSNKISMSEQRPGGSGPLSSHPPGYELLNTATESGLAIVVRELRSDPRISREHRSRIAPGIGGACVPLEAAGRNLGALFVNVRLPREITADELRVLGALADLGAYAIYRAQLFEETVKHSDRLAALRSIDVAISSSFDLKMILSVVLDNVIRELGVDAASILLLRAESRMLEFAAGSGFWTRSIETGSLAVGDGLPGRAILERDVTYIEDLRASHEGIRRAYLLKDEKFVSYYGVPLVAKGKVKGVLEIFSRSQLAHDAEWMQFLEALAGQTAIAIDSASTFQELQRSNRELALAYDATIEGWSHALDLRDRETEGHTLRVTDMALKLARAMGMDDETLVQLRRGGLLHDIGKMGVPDSVLLKPGKLTDEEWVIMRQHPRLAYDMLASIAYLRPALDIPYCHHERWDGDGYPRGLKRDEIPFSARIFSVVDVWDALSSDRPYRPAWREPDVIQYLSDQRGKQFDPAAVDAFLNLIAVESLNSPTD
jgi:putative nucleotidyltransferase with HDIG domain